MIDVVLHMLLRARVMLMCLQYNTLDRGQMYKYKSIRLYMHSCAPIDMQDELTDQVKVYVNRIT